MAEFGFSDHTKATSSTATSSTDGMSYGEASPIITNIDEQNKCLGTFQTYRAGYGSTGETSYTPYPCEPEPRRLGIFGMKMSQIEKCVIIETLEMCHGNRAQAARKLGLSKKTIYNKIKKHKLTQFCLDCMDDTPPTANEDGED